MAMPAITAKIGRENENIGCASLEAPGEFTEARPRNDQVTMRAARHFVRRNIGLGERLCRYWITGKIDPKTALLRAGFNGYGWVV